MKPQLVIALLGRRDQPTDAVEDYCRHLGEELAAHNLDLQIRRVPWNEHGWSASLQALRLQAEAWRESWILVQYTALAWSARGFPRRFLRVLGILRKAGARIAVVFHDAEPFGGTRLIDRLRRAMQLQVMRTALIFSDHAVFTVTPERLSWPPSAPAKSSFIPVGVNLPGPLVPQRHEEIHSPPTVGVFSITGGSAGDRETRDVIAAVRYAAQKLGRVRLLVFGRHAEVREHALREGLRDVSAEVDVCGVIDDTELVERFAASDVLLFVRGTISSRRSSAISGIGFGLPVVAIEGSETARPITDAGVILLPERLEERSLQRQLGEALVRVLSEDDFRAQLVQRSRTAHAKYFSWQAIAARYLKFLELDFPPQRQE
jgi:glycosyltransferase involved in cell wall biosynthesis